MYPWTHKSKPCKQKRNIYVIEMFTISFVVVCAFRLFFAYHIYQYESHFCWRFNGSSMFSVFFSLFFYLILYYFLNWLCYLKILSDLSRWFQIQYCFTFWLLNLNVSKYTNFAKAECCNSVHCQFECYQWFFLKLMI